MTHLLIPDVSTPGNNASDDNSVVIRLGFTAEPIVDIGGSSESPLYSECLARMMVADKLLLTSGDFVDDLDAFGGIDLLDVAVVDLVLDALMEVPHVALGCNISPRTLSDPVAWKRVVRSIDERSWLAQRLTLEITETCPLNEIPGLGQQLAEMQRLGCRIAIDDFGASFGSTKHLQDVDIAWDLVKIDRACFVDLRDHASSYARLHSLVSSAARFSPIVVVEGIETYDRLSAARDAGACFGQGWLFDGSVRDRWMRPEAASRLTAAMKRNCTMQQQVLRPVSSSGQNTCIPHKRLLSAGKMRPHALVHDVADFVWSLVKLRGIGEMS